MDNDHYCLLPIRSNQTRIICLGRTPNEYEIPILASIIYQYRKTRFCYWYDNYLHTNEKTFITSNGFLDGILLAEVMIAVTSKRYSNPLSGRPLYVRLRTYYVNVIGMNYVFPPP